MLPVPCDRCSVQGLCPESINWASQDALAVLEGLRGTLLTSQGGRTLSAHEGHERGHVETQVVLKCSQQSSRASPSGEGPNQVVRGCGSRRCTWSSPCRGQRHGSPGSWGDSAGGNPSLGAV